jgi:hypothetical protein
VTVESQNSSNRFREGFALLLGCFLGLAILKFGNPVILDGRIIVPGSWSEALALTNPWPTRWGNWLMLALAAGGAVVGFGGRTRGALTRGLVGLPVAWFGWQIFSASQTVDAELSATTLLHFGAVLAAYFHGAWVVPVRRGLSLLFVGLLAAVAICLVRSVNQRLVEFPQDRRTLTEGERTGWTNFPPSVLQQMKSESLVVTTNGVDIANPIILAKLAQGRVHGTLVYPNALAGMLLLLGPVALVLAVRGTATLRPVTRWGAVGLTLFLVGAGFFWTGSKSAWLVALLLAGLWLLRLPWPMRWKLAALAFVLVGGLVVFGLRFRAYFAAGATSVGARFDYWRAAVQTAGERPLVGTGPGTFQRPYARLKAPESEMARLAHNDYLEQFSDSGLPGGVLYAAWIATLLAVLARRAWTADHDPLNFALFLGLAGWFAQGFMEFALYIPALAWTAFALAGVLLARTATATRTRDTSP